jgi:hypothetical protein
VRRSISEEIGVCELLDLSTRREIYIEVGRYFGIRLGGKLVCNDLTGVFLLVKLTTENFIVGQTILKVVLSKMAKHEKMRYDNAFIPFCI